MAKKEVASSVIHNVPQDLRKIIASDKVLLAAWENITPLARNEWLCWIESVKKPETRKIHLKRIQTELKEGKRRPCCWAGCIHRFK